MDDWWGRVDRGRFVMIDDLLSSCAVDGLIRVSKNWLIFLRSGVRVMND